MMLRKICVLFSASLLLPLALLTGCGKNAPAQKSAGTPEVTVVTLAPQPVTLTTELPGRTSAHFISEVRPQVGGIILKRLFTEGGEVRAGQVLYQIDPATFKASYDNARASLAKAEANAIPARLKAQRYANLVGARAVSKQDNDDAQAAYKQAEAAILSAKAALETARINLSYTRVTAPISGRIGKSSVTSGALVTASQATALATIQQINPIYVDVTQSSTDVLRLKRELETGQLKRAAGGGVSISLRLPDGRTYARQGSLQFTDITVDQSTGEVTLRAVFPNPNRDLLPGMYVRAFLTEGVDNSALLVPQEAVSRDNKGGAEVLVVKPEGTVEMRPIEVSRMIGSSWLVQSGLKAGDRVIVQGLQSVHVGMKVKAVETAMRAEAQQANATKPAESAAAKPAAKASAKPVVKASAKPVAKPTAQPAAKPLAKKAKQPAANPSAVKRPAAKRPAAKPVAKTAAKPAARRAAAKSVAKPAAKPAVTVVRKPAAPTRHVPNATKPAVPEATKGAAYSPPKGQWPVSRLDGGYDKGAN